MAHQLYVLQTLTLGLLEQRMKTKMDPQDQDAHDKIKVGTSFNIESVIPNFILFRLLIYVIFVKLSSS